MMLFLVTFLALLLCVAMRPARAVAPRRVRVDEPRRGRRG
jgi:hypothetical protein